MRRSIVVVVLAGILFPLLSAGCSPPSLLLTPVFDSSKLREQTVQGGKGFSADKVAIIEVEGLLINARMGGSWMGASENRLSLFAQQLERAASDGAVKAVVLRVNSPGGTVTASDTMYDMVKRFREETGKPVVASCQEVAASGAYYVSCATDAIIAQPTTVVGSIGVIFSSFNVEGTLNMIGVRPEVVKSGRLKDMGSPFKPLGSEERQLMQRMIDEYHARFVAVVRAGRPLPHDATIEDMTDGRVFTGEQAQALGLVDRLGTLQDALDVAREKANAKFARAVMYKRPYGYTGSIYATQDLPPAMMNGGGVGGGGGIHVNLPESALTLPRGFYYLWEP